MLIDGHLRAETIGEEVVPVLILDVNEIEADKILATLDPLAALAEKDAEQLASLLSGLVEQQDKLASLVWADYEIEPLLSADWSPPQKEALPTREQKSDNKPEAIAFTQEQRETIDSAVSKCRDFNEDDTLTPSQCIELICQDYLTR
jgi:hypothetical protein